MIAARSPAAKPESSSAAASGWAAARNCPYVSRERSRSRSASIRQTSSGQRSSASRKAAPSESYFFKSSIKNPRLPQRHKGTEKNMIIGGFQRWNRFIRQMGSYFCRFAFLSRSGQSKPGLNARSQGAEVADAGDFVVRKLDAKVIFQAREQFKSLQAVDP